MAPEEQVEINPRGRAGMKSPRWWWRYLMARMVALLTAGCATDGEQPKGEHRRDKFRQARAPSCKPTGETSLTFPTRS